jgi:hypothetical protein
MLVIYRVLNEFFLDYFVNGQAAWCLETSHTIYKNQQPHQKLPESHPLMMLAPSSLGIIEIRFFLMSEC